MYRSNGSWKEKDPDLAILISCHTRIKKGLEND
jgi:hypothetical protein